MGHTTSKDNCASVLVIDQACDNEQLLVSLSKNQAQWLSPVGWTHQQKVTLLDCRAKDGTTEVDIPSEFAKDIKSGDVLVLRCSELDLKKEIIWEASEIEVRNAVEPVTVSTKLASGLLSRFKTSKIDIAEDIRTDAQVRAEEAERAAQAFKAKMDAATEAKERAQKKALDAAREAEAALKMEAERIAEMERAAKAFEEAERLKQDEQRRVEEERRAEEARLAEEARKIEEARLREITAKKESDRLAALERYKAALDITCNEEMRLKKRLSILKEQAKTQAANTAVQSDDLDSRRRLLVATEQTAVKRAKTLQNTLSKLDISAAQLVSIQSEAESLKATQDEISARIMQADTDYQDAQKKAEAAIAYAQQRRAELDAIRAEDGALSVRLAKSSETLSAKSHLTDDLTQKTQKLREKSDSAQAELTQAKLEIEAIEKNLHLQAETTQNLRLEIEATQQAIEDRQARELAQRGAIDHLELGGAPEDLADIDLEARDYTSSLKASKTVAVPDNGASPSIGLMSRVRSTFARGKDAEISIDVNEVTLQAANAGVDPVLLSGVDQSPTFFRRHSSSLMAMGAVLGGIAIVGGGLVINKSASPKLEVKAATPVPTQVASVVATAPKRAITASAIDSSNETIDIVEDNLPEEIVTPEPVAEMKFAEVVDPVGFAFDLPDMWPTTEGGKKAAALKIETPVTAALPKEVIQTKNAPTDDVKKASIAVTPSLKKDEKINYPELTKDVQNRLTGLGFYSGDIDGLHGSETAEAIRSFREIFALPEGDNITGALLTALKRAEREQEATLLRQQSEAEAQSVAQLDIKIAEASTIEVYDNVQAFPATPVTTDTLPVAVTKASRIAIAPVYVAPDVQLVPEPVTLSEPEPLKVASLPTIPEPEPAPVIKEASILKNASASYPSVAQRRNYFVNVAIVVAYDIDDTGRPQNLRIASNDHDGKYNDAFEKEALKAIDKMRYKPRTINGTATTTSGKEKRIVFRVE